MSPSLLDRYYTDFEDWLTIATSGLNDAAKARLVEDMSEHYAEAVSELVVRGVSKEDAETEALEQLGQPSAVRREYERRFRISPEMKTFFRYYDEMTLAKRNKYRLGIREMVVIAVCPAFLFGVFASNAPGASERAPYFAFLIVGAVITAAFAGRIADLVAERHGVLSGYRTLLAMHIMQFVFLGGYGCFVAVADSSLVVPGAIFTVMFVYAIAQEIRNWLKIRPVIERVT